MNQQTQNASTITASWDASSESGSGRNSWISSRIRVAELVFDATRANTLQMQFDGSINAIGIQMQQVQTPGSYTQSLMIKARSANIYDEPWIVGNSVTLWFAKRDGFYAFRCEILSESRNALVLSMPEGVLRHCRRGQQRYRVPTQVTPRVKIALADGTWKDTAGLGEISTGGLSAQLPAGMTLEFGSLVRLGLQLQPDRLTELNVTVRHTRTDAEGHAMTGFEFVNLSHTSRLALERYFLKTKAAPLPDIVTSHLPTLPESVRSQLCQNTPASVTTAAAPRRTR
jgi:c-di-GMP-binding flagellar brake protein YcgR